MAENQNERIWKSFLLTLSDAVFFNLIRNYLGPVQTPYNKHDLVQRLTAFLQRDDIQQKILDNLGSRDIELLSAIDMLEPEDIQTLLRFFSPAYSASELYTHLLNLEDRLLIFRNPETRTISLNPMLAQQLRKQGVHPGMLFPSEDAKKFRMPMPWLNDMLVMGFTSLIVEEQNVLKTDGNIRKSADTRIATTFPVLSGNNSPAQLQLLAALERLNLIELREDSVQLPWDMWTEWAQLPAADRHLYYWAAFVRSAESSTVRTGSVGDDSRYLEREVTAKLAGLLKTFLTIIDQNRAYRRETVMRMLQIIASERAIIIRPGLYLDTMISLELLSAADGLYQVNPYVGSMLTAADDNQSHSPAVIVQSDYHISIHPHAKLEQALALAFAGSIERYDIVAEYELDRSSLFRALSNGIKAKDLSYALDNLSGHHVPQNILFSINSWIDEFEAVNIRAGYLIQVQDQFRGTIEHCASNRYDVIQVRPDAFLFPAEPMDWVEELEEHGLHVRTLLNLAGSSEIGTHMPFPPLGRSAARSSMLGGGSTVSSAGHTNLASDDPQGEPRSGDKAMLLEKAREMNLPDDVESELILRIENRLILEENQIHEGILRSDVSEARGLNYNAKLSLINMAISNSDLLEFFSSGSDTAMLLRPIKIQKKPGNASDLLEARTVPDDSETVVSISKARLIRRVRGRLFNNM